MTSSHMKLSDFELLIQKGVIRLSKGYIEDYCSLDFSDAYIYVLGL
jgi:hypothetical protein